MSWANRTPLSVLAEHFPSLHKGEINGEMIAWCPLEHPDGRPISFTAHEMDGGLWAIDFCDCGDSPSEIWNASKKSRDPGGDDGEHDKRRREEPPTPESENPPGEQDALAAKIGGAKVEPSKEPLSVSVADFFAGCGKTVEYIVERYLPKSGLLVVGGAPKAGKTWFAGFIIGEALSAGHNVLIVEKEGAKEALKQRLEPFLRPDAKGSLFVS